MSGFRALGCFGQVVHHPNQSAALSACDTAREIQSQTLAELLPPGSNILPGLLLIRAWILAKGPRTLGRDGGGTEGEAAAGIDGALLSLVSSTEIGSHKPPGTAFSTRGRNQLTASCFPEKGCDRLPQLT